MRPSANNIRLFFAVSLAAPRALPQHTYPSTQQAHWRFKLDVLSPLTLAQEKDVNVAFLDAVCVSVTQFCENTVNNLRDSCNEDCKPLVFNRLHGKLNALKYL